MTAPALPAGDAAAQRLVDALAIVADAFGPDVTVRQLATFLLTGLGPADGVEYASLERDLGCSKASVSRNLTKLSTKPGNWGVIDYRFDPRDSRRVYAVLSPEGHKLYRRLTRTVDPRR